MLLLRVTRVWEGSTTGANAGVIPVALDRVGDITEPASVASMPIVFGVPLAIKPSTSRLCINHRQQQSVRKQDTIFLKVVSTMRGVFVRVK